MKSYKVEIIANQSIQSDLFDALNRLGLENRYTLISPVHGKGSNGGRLGTPVWPEENFILILLVNDDKIKELKVCCELIKQKFSNEGLKLISQQVDILL